MNTFKQFITERVVTLPHSLNVPRQDMPQIRSFNVQDFLEFLKTKYKTTYKKEEIEASKLKPIQAHIDTDRVDSLLPAQSGEKPMVVSKDGYILDGHHRWYQALQQQIKVSIFRVSLNMHDLLAAAKHYPKVEYAQLTMSEQVTLSEQLILINNGADYGQIVFMAGGMASGKGFAGDNFIDQHKFKVIDPDRLKTLFLMSDRLKKAHPELADLDLKNPASATMLHDFIKAANWEEQLLANLLKGKAKAKDHLPNIIFDAAFKNLSRFSSYSELTREVGYTPQNTHLIWVLTNYEIAVANNRNRKRVAPDDLHLESHEGAADTLYKIVNGDLPQGLDGGIYVILNNPEQTIPWKSKDGSLTYDGKNGMKLAVERFKYIQLKKPGSAPINKAELMKIIYQWIYNAIPATHRTQDVFDDIASRADS